MSFGKTWKHVYIPLLLLLSRPVDVHAQPAAVDGTVLDPSGSAVVRAYVEFRNRHTGIRRHTVTNRDGFYQIGEIAPGQYDAMVEAGEFKTLTRENIPIHAGRKSRIDFTMEVRVASRGEGVARIYKDFSVGNVVDEALIFSMDYKPMDCRGGA